MDKLLLGVSQDYLYFKGEKPYHISNIHKPYFYAFTSKNDNIDAARKNLINKWKEKKENIDSVFSKISDIGEIEKFRSFWDFGLNRNVFKIFSKRSYFVPEISDILFFEHNLYTAEHDIPYSQRVICDLAAENKGWVFDSKGSKQDVNVLVYDIETTQYGEGKTNVPIDVIGWADFDLGFISSKDISSEDFSFDINDIPNSWDEIEINQLISRNLDEEIDNLFSFCKKIMDSDIISGHNLLGFDNLQIYNRINWFLKNKKQVISKQKIDVFEYFLRFYSKQDRSFHFGTSSDVLQFYPSCLDTYLGARKFYSFLNDFSLKGIAPFLGIDIKDRLILKPSEMHLDEQTFRYNRHDVQEQLGVTLNLIQQAMPLSFTTGMPFDLLFDAGAVQMWDHMSMIRAHHQKKLMPPICRVMSTSKFFLQNFNDCKNRREIALKARKNKDILSKETIRLVKYGEEMPYWTENPEVIYNDKAKNAEEHLAYHMPGGMTIKPDKDANSHFIPWWNVIVADVGAMYPTILKAMNIGADTVRIARSEEKADYWIWLKKIPESFLKNNDIQYREISKEDIGFADKGFRIGVKIDDKPGVVNCAMTGIMSMIAKVKKELIEAKEKGVSGDELNRLKMMYQSVKGARNAGTHGILSAPGVSGRQFNLWGAATITTRGQQILSDSLNYLKQKSIRVVYGDSVGSETGIILREKGLIKIVDIKDLYEEHDTIAYKKGNHEYKKLNDIECLSINKKGICEWKEANFVKRHPHSESIIEVQTQRGKISVTKNHSLYTISDGLKELLCKNINTKLTNIAHISNYDNNGTKIWINALEPLLKFNDELNIWLNIPRDHYTERLLKYHKPRNNSKGKVNPFKFIRMKISSAIDLYEKNIIEEGDIKKSFISSYNDNGKIPVIYDLDEDFARVLGAYAAEGSLYIRKRKGMTKEGAHIFICGHDFESLNELKKILDKKFNKSFKITHCGFDKNGDKYRIQGNSSTSYLFKFVLDCGQGPNGKKVSPYILSSTKSVQKAFMDEYIKGDGNYETKRRINPLLRIDTKSRKLVEGLSLIGLNIKYGYPSLYYRKEKSCYCLRFVQYNFHSIKHNNLTGLIPKKIREIKPKDGYVYDISVEDNNNFVCGNGLIPAHNTDGIYLGCSRSMGNVSGFAEKLGVKDGEKQEEDWLSKPDLVLDSIYKCNNKWRKTLNYPDFELEPEFHDCMIFVKHKNYLIFDQKNDKIEMNTKGNNFKGSDKADIARKALKDIMLEVLKDNPRWIDEKEARKVIRSSIVDKTKETIKKLDLEKVKIEDLTLIQSVQPANRYKPNQDGSMSTFGKRAAALEKLLGIAIKSRAKYRFVVTKKPLPGITNPSKSGVKPIDYMYPVELLKDKSEIDLDWYKAMIENYIKGAFGLSDMSLSAQTGLDAWM